MLTRCPYCETTLQFSNEQRTKMEQALARLVAGKTLAMKCPGCQRAIALDRSGEPPRAREVVPPPPPPNLDWLKVGAFQGEEKVEDVPMALILHAPGDTRKRIGESLEAVGYQTFMVDSATEAMERMRFVNFACIVCQEELEGALAQSTFHAYMRSLPMERRRYIFYILIGDRFHTLFDLEAMANSANLTVNTADLKHLDIVLRKAIPSYEELFGPLFEELGAYGKR